jgi:UTP--glucose-1-phosphate uridylyltransferase
MIQPVIQQMINDGHTFLAREIVDGTYYDTGDKLEYLKTVIDFGLNHPDFGDELSEFLRSRV